MKRIIGWILLLVIAVGTIFVVNEKRKIYEDISTDNTDIELKIRYKGLRKAVDFTMDDENIYVAFEKRILCIPISGEPYNFLEGDDLNIKSLEICGDKLFFISDHSLKSIHTMTGEIETYLEDIPSYGDYKDIIIKVYGDSIYLAIGAATNSGIVGEDNKWYQEYDEFHDIPSYDLTLKQNTEGAFVTKGSGNTEKQIIKGEEVGTSSIIEVNVNTKEVSTFAWGLRNIKGLDISSDGRLFATVGGYENRGIRPVKGDSDYIYEIKKGCWYGFPDYSGGDPLSSPRFYNGENKTELLLAEKPMNVPAPSYQHDKVDSLTWLVIDKGGIINKEGNDYIYFYDSVDKKINYSHINGAPRELFKFKGSAEVSRMKILNEALYILDGNNGFLYTIGMKNQGK